MNVLSNKSNWQILPDAQRNAYQHHYQLLVFITVEFQFAKMKMKKNVPSMLHGMMFLVHQSVHQNLALF